MYGALLILGIVILSIGSTVLLWLSLWVDAWRVKRSEERYRNAWNHRWDSYRIQNPQADLRDYIRRNKEADPFAQPEEQKPAALERLFLMLVAVCVIGTVWLYSRAFDLWASGSHSSAFQCSIVAVIVLWLIALCIFFEELFIPSYAHTNHHYRPHELPAPRGG